MRSGLLRLLFAGVVCAATAESATIFTTGLSGDNERPIPVSTPATGFASLTFNDALTQIAWELQWTGIPTGATAAHVHFAPPTAAGPVVLPVLPPPSGVSGNLSGIWTAADIQNAATTGLGTIADIFGAAQAGDLYFNVHSPANPPGEIRGQLAEIPEPGTFAMLLAGTLLIITTRRRVSGGNRMMPSARARR